MKKIFLFAIFIVLLVNVIGIIVFQRSGNTTTDRSGNTTTDRSGNTTTKRYSTIDKSNKNSYISIKGLPNSNIFYDMNADIIYYGKVCRNISEYMHLVDDKRIYDKQQAILLHKHHYYKFAKSYHGSQIEDMKGDFMSSVVRDYHKVTGVDAYITEVYNKAKADRSGNTTTKRYSTIDKSNKNSYISIKGLPNSDIFYDMNADIIYYGKVCRNISEYMHLVDDKRIYDKQQAILLHKHHYYKFAKSYHGSQIEDMKGDFMSSVVRDYHKVTGVDAYITEVYNKAKADR